MIPTGAIDRRKIATEETQVVVAATALTLQSAKARRVEKAAWNDTQLHTEHPADRPGIVLTGPHYVLCYWKGVSRPPGCQTPTINDG